MGCSQCNHLLLLTTWIFVKVLWISLVTTNYYILFLLTVFWHCRHLGGMHDKSFYATVVNKLSSLLQPGYCVKAYNSHPSSVMSLDFHPKKTDLLCFCDNDNEIRYFNLNTFSCTRISKVGDSSFPV